MENTIGRNVGIDEEHWRRIEALADAGNMRPNRLLPTEVSRHVKARPDGITAMNPDIA